MKKVIVSVVLGMLVCGNVLAANVGPSWLYSEPQYSNQVSILAQVTEPEAVVAVNKFLQSVSYSKEAVVSYISVVGQAYDAGNSMTNLESWVNKPIRERSTTLSGCIKIIPSMNAKCVAGIKAYYAIDAFNATKAAVYYGYSDLVTPADVMNLIYAEAQGQVNLATLRSLRATFNDCLLSDLVAKNRKEGKKTVGVVIPEYKAVIDAQNSGSNLVASLQAVGLVVPVPWDAGIADANARIAKIMSGEQMQPTDKDTAMIEMYLGVEGLRKFVEAYNKL
jgi:hypothetical protein